MLAQHLGGEVERGRRWSSSPTTATTDTARHADAVLWPPRMSELLRTCRGDRPAATVRCTIFAGLLGHDVDLASQPREDCDGGVKGKGYELFPG